MPDDYSMLQWYDPQAQQNAKDAEWQKQWNAANFGSPAGGQGQDAGLMLPAGAKPPSDANGQWVMSGTGGGLRDGDGGTTQSYARWTFIPNQPAAAPSRAPMPEEPAPQPQQNDGKTIYNDWDTYQQRARADVEGMNRMPFVRSDFNLVSLDPAKAMDQFYPAAWQTEGVQKTIGPNGQNIAPELQRQFGDAQFINTTKADWPSMLDALLSKGAVSESQYKALSDLAKPKKLDNSMSQAPQGLAAMLMK